MTEGETVERCIAISYQLQLFYLQMKIHGKLVREKSVNSSKSSSQYWHNLKRNM